MNTTIRRYSIIVLTALIAFTCFVSADELNNPCKRGKKPGPCYSHDPDDPCAWKYCAHAGEDEKCCEFFKFCIIRHVDDCCPGEKRDCSSGYMCTFKGNSSGFGGSGGPSPVGARSLAVTKSQADFRFGLGPQVGRNDVAGYLWLYTDLPSPEAVSMDSLQILQHADLETSPWLGDARWIRAPMADMVLSAVSSSNTAAGYTITCYEKGWVDANGAVSSGAVPMFTWHVFDPDAGTNGYTRLVIYREENGSTNQYTEFEWVDNQKMIIREGKGLREEHISWQWAVTPAGDSERTDIHEIYGANLNAMDERIVRTYRRFRFGDELIREMRGPEGDEILSLEMSYYTDEAEVGRFGNVASVINGDGSWARYDYDVEGRMIFEASPWLDSELTDPDGLSRVTLYNYICLDNREIPHRADHRWRTKQEFISNIWVKTTYRAFILDGDYKITIEEDAVSENAGLGADGNRRTETTYKQNTGVHYLNINPVSILHPNGTEDVYEYRLGDYTPSPTNTGLFVESATGTFIEAVEIKDALRLRPMKSVKTILILDEMGREVQSETGLFTGNETFVKMDWTTTTRDNQGRELVHRFANGLTRETTWDCCGKASEIQPDGQTMFYFYDMLGRETMRVKVGEPSAGIADITVLTEYDAGGRIVKQETAAGGLSMISSNQYDLAGRMTASWIADDLLTSYAYPDSLTQSIVLPGGATQVIAGFRDGQTKSITGTAQMPGFYAYGIESDGAQWVRQTQGIENGPAWNFSMQDRHEKLIQEKRPGFGGTILTNCYFYDEEDHLIKKTTPDAPSRLYEYNEYDELIRSGMDVDGDGELSLASMDRIQEQRMEYVQEDDLFFRQTTSITYPFDNLATAVTTSIARVQVGGTGCACEEGLREIIDARGNLTQQQTLVNAAQKTVTTVISRPTSTTPETMLEINGLLMEERSPEGLTYRYEYDALGRQTAMVDPRTGTNTTVYLPNGWVDYTEDAAGYQTTYQYDTNTSHRTATVDALSQTKFFAYDSQGRVTNTWGATYPVGYGYDLYGRMIKMMTWRNETSDPDVTQWLYDEATGLLTNKLYADGRGPSYEYDVSGRLTKRIWARGVETDYAYDALGQLISITYNDATPNVAFTYDRMGRQVTIADALGTRTNVYDGIFGLAEERMPDGSVLARTYDFLGRPAGIALDADYAVGYGYDVNGRFASVAVSNAVQVDYSYITNSSLLAGWNIQDVSGTNIIVAVSKTYEPHRDMVTSVTNTGVGTLISQFDYVNDAVGRRVQKVDILGATNIFGYNTRSELTDAIMGTNVYAYLYDSIGNRKETAINDMTHFYVANQLNQYTNIHNGVTNEPSYDDDGNSLIYNGWSFSWDAENRLVTATDGIITISNSYDYLGRRFQKAINGEVSTFLYDGWAMIREKSTATTNFYMYGLDLSGSLQDAGTIGGIIAASFGGTNVFYCYDANGNVSDLVNMGGSVVAHYEYSPYGQITAMTGDLADDNPYQFSTKYLDNESGLYYYGYRYYCSYSGRWINRDPLHELSFQYFSQFMSRLGYIYPEDNDISLYQFTFGDPINTIDIVGLFGRGQIPCGNCTICVDRNTSGDGQSPYHIHWKCGSHGRPRSCRGGSSADWPSGKGREGSPDIPNNIKKCLKNTRWNINPVEVSVPTTANCCKNESVDELVYVGVAAGTCVAIYGIYKVVKVCAGGAVGFLVAGPPGAIGGASLCLATP